MQTIKYAIKDFMLGLRKKERLSARSSPERMLKVALAKKDLQHVRFSYFKKGILGIEVDSSSRLYLLSLRKEDLLERLRKKLNGVKDIRFRLGALE